VSTSGHQARIVVGTDGSDGSAVALKWALVEAELRGATVDVVHAWQYPIVGDMAGMAAYAVSYEELEQAARELLGRSIESARSERERVVVQPVLAHGPAATALLDAADGADLLVVGSRGRGGFAGLLLGSVSQQCASHAHCPVTIVPAVWRDDSE